MQDLEPLIEEIGSLHRAVAKLEMSGNKQVKSDVYVENLDEVKKHLRDELEKFGRSLKGIIEGSKLPSFNISETIKLSNIGELDKSLKALRDVADALEAKIGKINFEPKLNVSANVPDVHVPEIKVPDIYIPKIDAPNVTVNPIIDINLDDVISALEPLKLLSRNPKNPLSVRLSDGKEFIEELTRAVRDGNEQLATVVSTSYGLTKDEYKAAQRELYDAATAANDSVSVGNTTTSVLSARSRISIILTNDSDEAIYVSKGATAIMNKGIRLNASGGAVVIDDWNGAISAICASGSKTLCYCETY